MGQITKHDEIDLSKNKIKKQYSKWEILFFIVVFMVIVGICFLIIALLKYWYPVD